MPNFNTIVAAGHIGKDAETRFLPDGTPVTKFSLAYSDKREKTTLWFTCTLWRKEKLAQYLLKGKAVMVSGTLGQHAWEAKDGTQRTELTIDVKDVAFLGSKDDDAKPAAPARAAAPRTVPAEDDDESVPF